MGGGWESPAVPPSPGQGAGTWLLGQRSEEKLAHLLLTLGQAWGRGQTAKGALGHLLPPQAWNLALGAEADAALLRRDRARAQAQPKKEAAPRDSGLWPWPSLALDGCRGGGGDAEGAIAGRSIKGWEGETQRHTHGRPRACATPQGDTGKYTPKDTHTERNTMRHRHNK